MSPSGIRADYTKYDHVFKVVLVGASGVGKTSLMKCFSLDQFKLGITETIGIQYASRIVQIEGKRIQVQIYDTAGQERYRSVVPSYYRGAVGAFLVYDISCRKSFEQVELWLKELLANLSQKTTVMVLVGNKSDLHHFRAVTSEEGRLFADRNQLNFIETSALDPSNVEKAFMEMLTKVCKIAARGRTESESDFMQSQEEAGTVRISDTPQRTWKQRCLPRCLQG